MTGFTLSILLKTYLVTQIISDEDLINDYREANKKLKKKYIQLTLFLTVLALIESLILSWISLSLSLIKLGQYHLEKNLEKVKPNNKYAQ
jgi:hypothetical protein